MKKNHNDIYKINRRKNASPISKYITSYMKREINRIDIAKKVNYTIGAVTSYLEARKIEMWDDDLVSEYRNPKKNKQSSKYFSWDDCKGSITFPSD